jgi:hypothetical protein
MGRGAYGVKRNDYDDDNDDEVNNNKNNSNYVFAEVRTNIRPGLVTHTDQSDERFR